MKYYKADDVLAIFSEEERPLNWSDTESEIQAVNDFDCYKRMIESLPTIEVSEGEWIEYRGLWKCSICSETENRATRFCPNCGAKMKGMDNGTVESESE